jgi:uncharacterized protein (DUF433 family)
MTFDRITQNPAVMAGKPTIRGMRVTVSMLTRQLAKGEGAESLLNHYPDLEVEDIHQAVAYKEYRKTN